MIYELFTQTLELPVDKQEAFAREHCTDKDTLKALLNLLTTHQTSNDFTFSAELSQESEQLLTQDVLNVGDHISVYQLIDNLGQGGMGSVFSAKRVDDAFEQQVAIKIIPPYIQAIIKTNSFNNEASLMAKLHHPNIRKVHDAGTLDSGVHYLVMELIHGVKLDEYLKKTPLTIKAGLTLFTKICHAVHHAHQHQVIHADIKAANILVDKHGEPHVLDFGIAKLFDNHNQNVASYYQAFSPGYASPELIETGRASIFCDIYSLGKLLALILDNQRLKKDSLLKYKKELLSIVELATNVLPHKRYPSVLELKNEIDLFISGQVVNAYKAPSLYKIKKFIFNRHLISVSASLIFVVVCSILIVNLIIQHIDLKREKYQTDFMLEKFSLVLDLDYDAKSDVEMTLANNYESRDEDEKAEILYKKIIMRFDKLTDTDKSFDAGSRLIKLLIKTNRFELIERVLGELRTKLQLLPSSNLPITASQAMFYHFFVNSTYHRSHNENETIFKFHSELMQNIKDKYWQELTNQQKAELNYSMNRKVYIQALSKVETTEYYPSLNNVDDGGFLYALVSDKLIYIKNSLYQFMNPLNNSRENYSPQTRKTIDFLESSPIFWTSTHQGYFNYEEMNQAVFSEGVIKFKENAGIYNVANNILTMDFGEGPESDSVLYASSELGLSVPLGSGDLTILAHKNFLSGNSQEYWTHDELKNSDWYHISDGSLNSNDVIQPSMIKINFKNSVAHLSKENRSVDVYWSTDKDILSLKSSDNTQASTLLIKVASDNNIIIVIIKKGGVMLPSIFVKDKKLAEFVFSSWKAIL